jgi:hypothetical protein
MERRHVNEDETDDYDTQQSLLVLAVCPLLKAASKGRNEGHSTVQMFPFCYPAARFMPIVQSW